VGNQYNDYDLDLSLDIYQGTYTLGTICGGLVGYGANLVITRSVFNGYLIGDSGALGGIATYVKSILKCGCYANINNSGLKESANGGLCCKAVTINNCYTIGKISSSVNSINAGIACYVETLDYTYSVNTINDTFNVDSNSTATSLDNKNAFTMFNNDLINDVYSDVYGQSTPDMKTEDTYTKYNRVYKQSTEPDVSFGNEGDIVILPKISIIQNNGTIGSKYISYTKLNGIWVKVVFRNYNIISTDIYKPTVDDGDFYAYRANSSTTNIMQYKDSVYNYIQQFNGTLDISYLYIYTDSLPGITPIDKYSTLPIIDYEGSNYRFYASENERYPYDFDVVWIINPSKNYGYPYLRELNYQVPGGGILKVRLIDTTIDIPLVEIADVLGRLTVALTNGLSQIQLVDATDPKASPIKMMTPSGVIKRWSL
jgi:hypothetical protein